MTNDDDNDYEVGYGKPPREHQWPKGTSGNSKGRPKKTDAIRFFEDINKIIMDEAREEVALKQGNKKVFITSIQAVIKKLKLLAMNGDRIAAKEFFKIVHSASLAEKETYEEMLSAMFEALERFDKASDEEIENNGLTRPMLRQMAEQLEERLKERFPD